MKISRAIQSYVQTAKLANSMSHTVIFEGSSPLRDILLFTLFFLKRNKIRGDILQLICLSHAKNKENLREKNSKGQYRTVMPPAL